MKKTNKRTPRHKSVRVVPLGGLDAIGRNLTVFETSSSILVVDCGIMFPTPEMPGIDLVIPDFNYLLSRKDKIKGLVITHGHEDHIGAVPFFLKEFDVPVYGSLLSLGLIRKRLEERPTGHKEKFTELVPGETINIGDFSVEPIPVNHSIPGGMGLVINSPCGRIIHTGDFKIDHTPQDGKVTDIARLAHHGEAGVLLLLSDSTNAEKPGYSGSEKKLNQKLFDIFSSARGRIIVATFASNISRIQQILNAAQKYNRKVIISGRSMQKNIEIAKSLGHLSYKENLIIDLKEAATTPDKKQTIICTGTQGEPMSALTRISNGTHRHFTGCTGDTIIITASVIPGNERTIGVVINALLKQGAIVHYEKEKDIHVSGHGSQEELKLMIGLTRPKFFMPIHGEYKQLKAHANLALEMNIPSSHVQVAENGDVLELTARHFKRIEKHPIRTVFLEGNYIGDITGDIIKERQMMSTDGIIIVTLVLQEGFLVQDPIITTKGFAPKHDDKVLKLIKNHLNQKLVKIFEKQRSSGDIKSQTKRAILNMLQKQTGVAPLVEINLIEL